MNGRCLNTAEIGQACETTAQCLGQSQCIDGFCECILGTQVVDNVCVGSSSSSNNDQCSIRNISIEFNIDACPISGQSPYVEPGSTTPRICTPNTPSSCPPNFVCQFSPNIKQNVCCGSNDGSASMLLISDAHLTVSLRQMCAKSALSLT